MKSTKLLIENKDSKGTKRPISNSKKFFLGYALTKEKKTEQDVEKIAAEDLESLLFEFYPSVRKTDGDYLKLSYLKTIWYGVSSYLKTSGFISTPQMLSVQRRAMMLPVQILL